MKRRDIKKADEADRDVHYVDWKADPYVVMDAFDMQLLRHGLEVLFLKTGGDDYAWKIVKRGSYE